MTDSYVTPLVRKLAAEHGVDLEKVRGSGVGGRIRKSDVLASAGVDTPAPTPAARPSRTVFASNPLVARARAAGVAAAAGTEPTLFASGDLPPFTASGLDPQLLLQVPAAARHPMARAETRTDAMAIFDAYSGPNGDVAAATAFRYDDGNLDYETRVIEWIGDRGVPGSGEFLLNDSTPNPWMPDQETVAARAASRTAAASAAVAARDDSWFRGARAPDMTGDY